MVEPQLVLNHHRRGAAASRNLRDRVRRRARENLVRAADYPRLGLDRRLTSFEEVFFGEAFFLVSLFFFRLLGLPGLPLSFSSSLSSIFSDSFSSTSSSVSSSRSSPSGSV